jgi:hypothetical protein
LDRQVSDPGPNWQESRKESGNSSKNNELLV